MNIKEMVDSNIILKIKCGSALYGTFIEGTSDIDTFGVCVTTKDYILGTHKFDMLEQRTNPSNSDKKNTKADSDYTVYSIQKYFKLLSDNNPNVLETLFVDEPNIIFCNELGKKILNNKHLFLSKRAYYKFSGYAHAQKRKLLTKESTGLRKALVDKYGSDCYSEEDTEFLTEKGWVRFDAITKLDKLATINIGNKQIEYDNYSNKIDKLYTGNLYIVEPHMSRCVVTENHNMLVSPSHRNPLNKYSINYNEYNSDWKLISLDDLIKATRSNFHVLQKPEYKNNKDLNISDNYLKLSGLFISEGCIIFRDNKVKNASISQTENGKLEVFSEMDKLSSIYKIKKYKYKQETRWLLGRTLAEQLYNDFGHLSKNKKLPIWCFSLSKRQIEILWKFLCLGDGTINKYGEVYYSISYKLVSDLQALLFNVGILSSIRSNDSINNYNNKLFTMHQLYRPFLQKSVRCLRISKNILSVKEINESKIKGNPIKKLRVVNHRVVCFEMPNGTLITRSKGKIAIHGNCKYSAHLLRLLLFGIELLNTSSIKFPTDWAKYLIQIRKGEWALSHIIDKTTYLEEQLVNAFNHTKLPELPDLEAINKLQIKLIEEHWIKNLNN